MVIVVDSSLGELESRKNPTRILCVRKSWLRTGANGKDIMVENKSTERFCDEIMLKRNRFK